MFIMAATALRIELTIYWPLRERYSSGYGVSTDINITNITHYWYRDQFQIEVVICFAILFHELR